MKKQMLERDRDGLTVAMHAAMGGNGVMLCQTLVEIRKVQVRTTAFGSRMV